MEATLVVHLVAPRTATDSSSWDSPGGSVRHAIMSWRDAPRRLPEADIVVAHGRRALVAAQRMADLAPRLVYRPAGSDRIRRHRWRRLHAGWIAAPNGRIGRATAASLGLDRSRIILVGDEDRAAWSILVSWLLYNVEPASDEFLPLPARRLKFLPARARRTADHRADPAPVEGSTRALDDNLPVMSDESTTKPEVTTRRARTRRARTPAGAPPTWRTRARNRRPLAAALPAPSVPVALPAPAPVAPAAEPPPVPERPSIIATPSDPMPATLATGIVEPTNPGHRWWMYRRAEVAAAAPERARPNGTKATAPPPPAAAPFAGERARTGPPPTDGPPPSSGGETPDPEPRNRPRRAVEIVSTATQSGLVFCCLGIAILVTVAICARLGMVGESVVMIPLAGLFLALAAARRITRNHPDESFAGRWLVIGLGAKLAAAYFRYFTEQVTYNKGGDATEFDRIGRELANVWRHGGTLKPPLSDLRQTNFIRWFTGVVYYVFGSNMLTGTFVFALLALIGSYFWYRATVEAVPMIDRRLYLGFVMFAPSILFWPALIGKEALMQLGLGTFALGVSFMLRQRLLPGLAVCTAGGWLLWVVRPHLLMLVAIAGGAAYLAGRVGREGRSGFLSRPLGIIVVAFLVAFTIGQGASFLGLKDLSFTSIKAELDATTLSTEQGGSSFHNGGNSLNPLFFPQNAVTVFLRPFPWEIDSGLQIVASLESMALAWLCFVRRKSLRIAFARSRDTPYLMFCWVLCALYAVAFSAFANFGLLVRQRSLVFAALLVLFSIDPEVERSREEAQESSTPRAPEWTAGGVPEVSAGRPNMSAGRRR